MSIYVQGEGSFKLGPVGGALVEFGFELPMAKISKSSNAVVIPATLGFGEEDEEGGTRTRTLSIDILERHDAGKVWSTLDAAYESDSQELAFELISNDGPVSADNKKRSGVIRVLTLDLGGAVGALRTQTLAARIKAGTYEEAVTAV